ncbi:hypothetical protein [Trinickia dinghuensis]|uniref:hypothetical protein n=1 Tax=Trinickia dinghuensis TaxID=2291023 RepID=UPI0011C07278|nr:hypothetical protein [Trinickia dinghuensis]
MDVPFVSVSRVRDSSARASSSPAPSPNPRKRSRPIDRRRLRNEKIRDRRARKVASQSQKALKPIFFHKDLANHFVRPDWVNILGLRSSVENEVYTSFVRNKDLLNELDEQTQDMLRRPEFYTPFDDLTMYKSAVELGQADMHPILGGATPTDIRFFENRTEGRTPQARHAVARLVEALHRLKKRVLIQPGDLLGSANNDCLHNKDVGTIRDEKALKERWLMKTVNVRSLRDHHAHLIEGRPRIVNG